MFPNSTTRPPGRTRWMDSANAAGTPVTSTATSAPAPPVSAATRAARSSGVSCSRKSITISAPNRCASSSRPGTPSMTIVFAPRAFATASAQRPRPPAPCTTTCSPDPRPEGEDAPQHLVAQHAPHLDRRVVPAPDVKLRAADVGAHHFQEHLAGPGPRDVVGLQFYLPGCDQDNDRAAHVPPPQAITL